MCKLQSSWASVQRAFFFAGSPRCEIKTKRVKERADARAKSAMLCTKSCGNENQSET